MCQEVPAGLIIGAILSRKKTGRITHSDLYSIKEKFREFAPKYYIDFSRDSLDFVAKTNRGYFEITNYEIRLCNIANQAQTKKYYDEVLGAPICDVINTAFPPVEEQHAEELVGH